ncbi:MAG: fused MFS/spermidine synthase [Myxococcales bacterium]|nr:fused MFS/spermidine synthase [Myxococcales bacterium]
MLYYSITIFTSAFLLFQVQPLLAKYVLPWFGGGAGVWSACLVFFQTMLLLGYAYAHALRRYAPRYQHRIHLALLVVSGAFLPIMPSAPTDPTASPDLGILVTLATTVGIPYLLLSSTGPLIQSWFASSFPKAQVYRLYALSNIGSLLALLSYPLVVEPHLSRTAQVWTWSAAYVAFGLATVLASRRTQPEGEGISDSPGVGAPPFQGSSAPPPQALSVPHAASPSLADVGIWMLLAGLGSAMLVATSSQMSQEVAAVPFLWIIPLSIYLLSFIICFDRPAWYRPRIFRPLLLLSTIATIYALGEGLSLAMWIQLTVYPVTLFVVTMVCHGELVRRRPDHQHLTLFYLAVSAGGALGGSLVALGAPLLLSAIWDLQICLALSVLVAGTLWIREAFRRPSKPAAVWATGCAALVYGLAQTTVAEDEGVILLRQRNFYGSLQIERKDGSRGETIQLNHGQTQHGIEFMDAARSLKPTSYYSDQSGIGRVLRYRADAQSSMRVGIVGLGVGTLAAYARPEDHFTYYEINPAVEEIARRNFSYLRGAKGKVDILLGDARLVMEKQLARGQHGIYDVLAIDAFSSDAIPTHLLTTECVNTYWQLLKNDGILVIHITNRFIDLRPIMRSIAKDADALAVQIDRRGSSRRATSHSVWVAFSRDRDGILGSERIARDTELLSPNGLAIRWTDDHTSLLPLLDFGF